jgi:hypothetical protein
VTDQEEAWRIRELQECRADIAETTTTTTTTLPPQHARSIEEYL